MNSLSALLSIVAWENLVHGQFARQPEDCAVMDASEQVLAWHEQGADEGPIAPVYQLVARACSRMTMRGGTVVDLGCGTGRFASYLARLRTDLQVIGLDLSAPMVDVGNAALRREGLSRRVELRQGDMTSFASQLPTDTRLVNCLFALHHLPDLPSVVRCLREIRGACEALGCGFLVFDLARPRHRATAEAYPRAFTPDAPVVFQLDSTRSLLAAYSHGELGRAVNEVFGDRCEQARSRLLPLYQAFWRPPAGSQARSEPADEAELPLSSRARWQYRALRGMMSSLPA